MNAEPEAGYLALAASLTDSGILSDPWLDDGRQRFCATPVQLTTSAAAALCRAAEAMAALHDEVAWLCAADEPLRRDFLTLTPTQVQMWESAAPQWHGLARADVFITDDGLKVCELNSDTPSGEAEAVLLNEICAEQTRFDPSLIDPNRSFPQRYCAMLETMARTLRRPRGPLTVGVVYPTDQVEDLSMIALYRRWFEQRGWRVVIGSPYNLASHPDGVMLFNTRCDVIVRHYKTDWWSEREVVWKSATPFPDSAPLTAPLEALLRASRERTVAVLNPFGAVVTQNKRAMAMMWEARARFSPEARQAIDAYVPYTARLERVLHEVRADRAGWVLKSDYGCEGAEVLVGAEQSDAEWTRALDEAIPGRFIAQRYFRVRTDEHGFGVNHGVYLVGGHAAGFFSRVHRGSTGTDALTAPTFVKEVP